LSTAGCFSGYYNKSILTGLGRTETTKNNVFAGKLSPVIAPKRAEKYSQPMLTNPLFSARRRQVHLFKTSDLELLPSSHSWDTQFVAASKMKIPLKTDGLTVER